MEARTLVSDPCTTAIDGEDWGRGWFGGSALTLRHTQFARLGIASESDRDSSWCRVFLMALRNSEFGHERE